MVSYSNLELQNPRNQTPLDLYSLFFKVVKKEEVWKNKSILEDLFPRMYNTWVYVLKPLRPYV